MVTYIYIRDFELELLGSHIAEDSLVVIIEGDLHRGMVRHCSPGLTARGVRAGDRMTHVRRRFPQVMAFQEQPAFYEKVNREVTLFLIGRVPAVERSGAHGWFVDLTGCERLLRRDFAGWGVQIITLLKSHFGLTAQIGIGANKVLAELSCRLMKPGSVFWLLSAGDQEIIHRVSLDQVPRLSEKQRQIFRDRRIQWVWELRALGEECLRQWCGIKEGSEIWRTIHGVCNEPIKPSRIPQILKKTYSFPHATANQQDVIRAGVYLSGSLYHEIKKLGGVPRKISCRLIYVDNLETSREIHLAEFRQEEEYVAAVARMLGNLYLRRVQVRSLQLKCPLEFEASEQQDLFSEQQRLKRQDLNRALKDIREKYGVESLHRVSGTVKSKRNGARAK